MNLHTLKLFVGVLLALLGTAASASLLSVNLNTGGFGLTVENVTAPGATSFDLCVYNTALGTCASGLQVDMTVSDTAVAFTMSGSTGAAGASPGNTFTLTLSDFVFDPAAVVTGITAPSVDLQGNAFLTSTFSMGTGEVIFTGDDVDDGELGITPLNRLGLTATFDLQVEAQAPAPNVLALFGLALAAMGYARRRRIAC